MWLLGNVAHGRSDTSSAGNYHTALLCRYQAVLVTAAVAGYCEKLNKRRNSPCGENAEVCGLNVRVIAGVP